MCTFFVPVQLTFQYLTDPYCSRTGHQHSHATKSQEYAIIAFDLTADLTSLFNYNTKQVFAYLSVAYNDPPPDDVSTTSKWSDNDAIIWDAIITDVSQAKLHVPKEQATYKINDISGKFHERNASVRLAWNVQPRIGALYWGQIEAPLDEVEKDELLLAENGGYGDPEEWEFDFPTPWKKKVAKTASMKAQPTEVPAA